MNPNSGKSSRIITRDNLDYTDAFAPTAANFPCLKAWWPCPASEFTDNNGLLDVIGGLRIGGAGTITAIGASANTLKLAAGALAITGGNLPDMNIAGKTTVFMVFGKCPASNGFALGSAMTGATTARLSMHTSATATAINDGTTNITGGTFSSISATDGMGMAVSVSVGGVLSARAAAPTTNISPADSASIATLAGTNFNIPNTFYNSSANSNIGAIGIMQFTSATVRSDLASIIAWMAARVYAGNKNIDPRLLGVS